MKNQLAMSRLGREWLHLDLYKVSVNMPCLDSNETPYDTTLWLQDDHRWLISVSLKCCHVTPTIYWRAAVDSRGTPIMYLLTRHYTASKLRISTPASCYSRPR
jgi:hypothetical protein